MALFIGRCADLRTRDLEDTFTKFGKLTRCEIKGTYGFITYEDERDAEEAIKECNGKEVSGIRITVDWSKDSGRYSGPSRDRNDRRDKRDDKCFNCGDRGHFARDCRKRDSRRRSRSRSPRRRRSRSPRERRRSRSPRDRSPKRRKDSKSPPPKRDRSKSR